MPRRKFTPQKVYSFTVREAPIVDPESLAEALDIIGCTDEDDVAARLQKAFFVGMELKAVKFGLRGRPKNHAQKWLIQELRKIFRENETVALGLWDEDCVPKRRGRPSLPGIRSIELDFIREAALAFGYVLPAGWRRQRIYFDHPDLVRGFDDPVRVREAKFKRLVEKTNNRRGKASRS